MGLFTRRSRWDVAVGALGATIAGSAARRAAKVGTGVVAAAVGVTAASAAVSAVRNGGNR